jgi:putative FmdB family regulatory protein
MPTYDYACGECEHRFSEMQSIKSDPLRICPRCSKEGLRRLVSPGLPPCFKGGGFTPIHYKVASPKPKD